MHRYFMLLISMQFLCVSVFAQQTAILSGVVLDENDQMLPGAFILLYPGEAVATTNIDGTYRIENIPVGSYRIEVSYVGFKTYIDSLNVNGNTRFVVKMLEASLSLQEFVVHDNYAESRKKERPLNIEIINNDYLKKHLGGSLMESLERLPGVSTIEIGSGQSKPVIRGLGFNRVLVVENGIKHESQQWGADHGLEIDQYAIDEVEVVKGPASLLYGSDAIGGIINIKQTRIPEDNTIEGSVEMTGKSNNDLLGTSVYVSGRKNRLFGGLRATILEYGDYKVPTDSVDIYSYRAPLYQNHLRNTAGNELGLHTTMGLILPNLQTRFYVSYIRSKSGFFANAHGLEPRSVDTDLYDKSNRDIDYPYQAVNHFKAINKSLWNWETLQFEMELGFQRNYREEWSQYVDHGFMPPVFPDTLDFDEDLERAFDKYVYSGNLKVTVPVRENFSLTIGTNSEFQDNRIDGRGFIIPAFKQFSMGEFAIVKFILSEKNIIQAGARYDFGHINTSSYNDWFPSPVVENGDTTWQYLNRAEALDRSFSNVSWSVGYNHNAESWSYRFNFGKSFRMPIAKELAANGVNYHHFSYEVGNKDLSPEVSYQLDAGIDYSAKKFAIGMTPFVNYFSNYIYLNPTPEHDRLYGNGNQVYEYTESEVFRAGGEIHAHYQILKPLQLGVISEYVYSEQLSGAKKGFTLPFSPPASAIFNLKYQKSKFRFLFNPYISMDFRLTAAQNNIVPPEESTDGYQVFNLGLGGDIKLSNQFVNISMQVQNLFNNKYFNHTSYYRLINVPEPGRNFILNVSIPISGKIKQHQ